MRGKRHYQKRIIKPDTKYNSEMVAKLINYVMVGGKKKTATSIVYKAFELVEKKLQKPELEVFEQAVNNVSPLLEVRSKRIGGATYQVPMEVRPERKVALSFRWMIDSAFAKQGKAMEEFLAQEIIDAYNKTGAAMTKRENMHKMAEANKAFAHFARF